MVLVPLFRVVSELNVAPSSVSAAPVMSRICTPTFVALPAAELCRARTLVWPASIAVPKKATAALDATLVSQSFSWMLKPTAELVAPSCASDAVRTCPNWTVWSTEPASTAQAALTTSPLKWTVPPLTVVAAARAAENWGTEPTEQRLPEF